MFACQILLNLTAEFSNIKRKTMVEQKPFRVSMIYGLAPS